MSNCRYFLKAFSLVMVGMLLACNTGEKTIENSASTFAYAIRRDSRGMVNIAVYDILKQMEIAVVPTGASVYHRYKAEWVTDSHILLNSSDIGRRIIDISDGCRIYFARIKKDGGSEKVVLYDEEWNQVGREIEIK
jgi:hypothetical protein